MTLGITGWNLFGYKLLSEDMMKLSDWFFIRTDSNINGKSLIVVRQQTFILDVLLRNSQYYLVQGGC